MQVDIQSALLPGIIGAPIGTMQVDLTLALLMGVIGALLGYLAGIIMSRIRATAAEVSAEKIIGNAHREAEVIRKDASVEAKDTVIRAREVFEEKTSDKRKEQSVLEDRISAREANLERKVSMIEKKEDSIDARIAEIEERKQENLDREKKLEQLNTEQRSMLQQVASMTEDQARQTLLSELEVDLAHDSARLVRHAQDRAKEDAEKNARKVIATAIERYAADQVGETTTCSVVLPNDEMKGRIIGREGRNIRSLEAAVGVNILIDDTPEIVVISGFDPLRREIARRSLEALINDGRIHPARIEEIVSKTEAEVDLLVRQAGDDANYELKLAGLAPEITRTLGRLKFRYSYGQNVLSHSVEMGHIMGMMASELGLDPAVGRRIGLLHDIGKALDHSIEGSHAIIGADLIRKHGESGTVVNAVAAHHNDVEPESIYAILTKAADAITASRPGARSETTDLYIQRLEKLERIANSFSGVEKSYAIQAGREVRVIVEPKKISDGEAAQMARNICKQVESELEYPGQIKVTVVRETRCVEYAR